MKVLKMSGLMCQIDRSSPAVDQAAWSPSPGNDKGRICSLLRRAGPEQMEIPTQLGSQSPSIRLVCSRLDVTGDRGRCLVRGYPKVPRHGRELERMTSMVGLMNLNTH